MPPNKKKPPFAPSDLDRFLLCCGERWAGGRCRKCGNGGDSPPAPPSRPSRSPDAPPRPARTQRGGVLNKGESRVLEHLRRAEPDDTHVPHGITLRFEDGTTYTPDVASWPAAGGSRPIATEVKGGYRGPGWEQGWERYRRARDVFSPWIAFRMIDSRDMTVIL